VPKSDPVNEPDRFVVPCATVVVPFSIGENIFIIVCYCVTF
jgi:hypothetical protein